MSLYDKMLFLGNMEDIEGLLHEADALRAELAKYRGMEVELAAVKNDMEGFRLSWRKHLEAIEESARKLMPGEPCHEGKCADCVDDRALLDAIHAALAAFDQGASNDA